MIAVRADKEAAAAATNALLQGLHRASAVWDSADSMAETAAGNAVIRAVTHAEAVRFRALHADAEAKWIASKEVVERQRLDFVERGFVDKAACCREISRQMGPGLRGLVVDRALRAAAAGIEALQRSCEAVVACPGGSQPSLDVLAWSWQDAQRRLDGLAEVAIRECRDAELWAHRGRLPDGELPPAIESSEELDIWASISAEKAVRDLMAKLVPQTKATKSSLSDSAVEAVGCLSKLTAEAGSTHEHVAKLQEVIAANRTSQLGGLCTAAAATLSTIVSELCAANEELLAILDESSLQEAEQMARSWTADWLASGEPSAEGETRGARLAFAAEQLFQSGPKLAAVPEAIASRDELKSLLTSLCSFATVLADPHLRQTAVTLGLP